MFATLIESTHRRERHPVAVLLSAALHVGVIAAAVALTDTLGRVAIAKPLMETSRFVVPVREKPAPPPEPVKPPAARDVAGQTLPKGFQILVAPLEIPDVIPPADLSRKATDEADFSGVGVAGGVANGVVGAPAPAAPAAPAPGSPYFEFQVEKPVVARPGNPRPAYPELLRLAGVSGRVLVQYVVDTLGRVEPKSVRILDSSNELFTLAVKDVLPRLRFLPAEVGSRRVRMVVQQPFTFTIAPR